MNSTQDFDKTDRVTESDSSPRHEEIASLAYQRYLEEGQPEGKALEHWLEAEAELKRRRPADAQGEEHAQSPDLSLETQPPNEENSTIPGIAPGTTLLSSTPATAPLQEEGSFFSEEKAAKTVKRGRKPRGFQR